MCRGEWDDAKEHLAKALEMSKAENLDQFFRIPLDSRGLDYNQYFDSGRQIKSNIEDYNSSNTKQLNYEELKKLLLNLDFIKDKLNA